MKNKKQQPKKWRSPKKVSAFLRFNDLPGDYFKESVKRKRKRRYTFDI
ncbi:hypothetical protein KAI92_00680 [Candidatus Parcubacteria bacterium]|nr:hypothetical protein [Candidatus Parcubacteria bacterium]